MAHLARVRDRSEKIQATAADLRLRGWLAAALACLATATLLTAVDGGAAALPSMGHALGTAVPMTALWLLSAAGLGHWLARWLHAAGAATTLALGIGALLVLVQWAGTTGVFEAGLPASLALLAPGWWLLARTRRAAPTEAFPAWAALGVGVSCGALLAAALVPPGFLWSTEFGGYDALSYHLQVPRDWLQAGSMRPLRHVAYSGFPGFVEGAFEHLMSMRRDPREAALACQMLHGAMMVVAAGTLGECACGFGGRVAQAVTTLAVLATPWITVTGSLAYSEGGVLLGAALAMRAAALSGGWRAGAASGLAMAVMVGAKASSAVLAVPAALAWTATMSVHLRDARWWASVACVGAVALFPWLLRNAVAHGAPVFPLLAESLGHGWWSPEQASRWDTAHRNSLGWAERLRALWLQGPAFGVGGNPVPGEPWRWLYGPLPLAGAASLAALASSARTRRVAVALALMAALTATAWMTCTHLQSRFLMPAVMPLALATGLVAGRLASGTPAMRPIRLASWAWALLPAWALLTDLPGRLALSGRVDVASGDLDLELLQGEDESAIEAVREGPAIEAALGTLFAGQRVLSVGWSAPFWVRPGVPLRWSTVWDENAIEEAFRQPDPSAWLAERFDLLVIDETMLDRWKSSGWLSPGITAERLRAIVADRPAMNLAGGRRLVSLRGDLKPAWPSRGTRMPDVAPY